MRIYYFNDEQKPVVVRVLDGKYDATNATGDTYTTLQSCEGAFFDISLPEGTVPYIKKWPNMVMISYLTPSALEDQNVS